MEVLGRGGMGLVWRAYDTVIDRIVALKILSADISRDEVFQHRFRREAHAVAQLNSPHIVPIHTHGEVEGRLFLDMRLVEGRDLQSVLDSGPLTPARAVHVIEQIAKGLNAAHRVGLLHRDVKPSNILLDDEDYAYLIDFGLVRTADERGLTTTGGMVGTFRYMAPERFQTEDTGAPAVDARSDVYALACVLYECLTAEHAIGGYTLEQQIGNHVVAPPPRPSDSNPALPRGFDAVIAKGMAKRPSDRYDTAPELAAAAREALTTPSSPPPVEPLAAPHNAATKNSENPENIENPANPVDRPSPTSAPAASSRVAPSRPWWVRRSVRISVAALLAVVAVVVALVAVSERGGGPLETALPFSGLREPEGVTVDRGGTVFVADTLHNRVLGLTAGSKEQTLLPFENLSFPTGVTTDDTGAVYVNDAGNKRVVVLAAGSKKQFQLPFNDLGNPTGLTVDRAHTVYVTDTQKNRVVALPAHSTTETVLPFTGLNAPTGLVVADNGTIYVADGGNNRVLALARGSTVQSTLPFTGLSTPGGVTVDTHGAVYVTDSAHNRALKLPPGSSEQVILPFASLDYPWGLAVGVDGTVYVAGHNNKIVALPQR
ncbi:serine/threonine-protein kinase PknD [Mycobacterium sp. E787]|uniref:serine/threonine-protein kinase PknD n=1 Tax=Mycobacterium sp. E787 TaxID=1834150 RepID=UPI002101A3C4|nr:serine/threonine-protein kinase PknD [Mycobacterium sp. E787]